MGTSISRHTIQRRLSTNNCIKIVIYKNNAKTYLIVKVSEAEEYDQVLSSFPFESDEDHISFPYSFPFSSMVPKVYQQVKEFIYACLKFSEDLNLRYIQVNC